MKRVRFLAVAGMLIFVALLLPTASAIPPGNSPLNQLQGNWINLYSGTGLMFSASEYAYTRGGWNTVPPMYPGTTNWLEMSGQEKSEFIQTATFEVRIDGVQIELNRFQYYTATDDPATDYDDTHQMWVFYYIQFEPFHFTAGEYVFEARWYIEFYGNPFELINTFTVTVTD